MNQKETSLDERILGLPPVHDWGIIYRDELYGAFDITKEGLLALESHLLNIASLIIPNNVASEIVQVVFSGKPSESYKNISEVINLRNPRKGRITGINIRVTTNEALASLWIDSTGLYSSHSIVLLFAGDSEGKFSSLKSSIFSELANLKLWYLPIRICFDRILALLAKIPAVIYMALFAMVVAIALLGIFGNIFFYFSDKSKHERLQQASEVLVNKISGVEPNIDPNTVSQIKEILNAKIKQYDRSAYDTFMPLIVGNINGLFLSICIIFTFYLFPRVVFEIGEGIRRYEQLTWLRRFVIGSIIICGIIVPLILKQYLTWF